METDTDAETDANADAKADLDLESFVATNLERYADTQGVLPERLEEFGATYRERGYLTRDQLYDIAYESSTRSAYHVERNPPERCRPSPRTSSRSTTTFRRFSC